MPTDQTRGAGPVRIRPRLIADDVHDQLLQLIVDGHIDAERPLSIDALARDFGVSSSPVREALARLEATGLVRRFALRGYSVAPALTSAELGELMAARLLIEPGAAAAAAARVPGSGIEAQLTAAQEALEAAPRGDQFEHFREYYDADRAFHRAVIAGTGNRFIAQAYEALGGQFQRFRLFSGRGVTDADATIAEHGLIGSAIAAGDAERAADAMRAHLTGVRDRALHEIADL